MEFAAAIEQAWGGDVPLARLLDQVGALERDGRTGLAVALYRSWLESASPAQAPVAYFNLGTLLAGAGRLESARGAYEAALALLPSFAQPRINLGLTLERLGEPLAALEQWRHVAEHTPDSNPDAPGMRLSALNHMGRLLEKHRRYDEAAACLERSLALEPAQPDALHHLLFLRQRLCRWPVDAPFARVGKEALRQAASALAMLCLSDDPQEQLATARRYIGRKHPGRPPALSTRHRYGHERLRIGYCSSDFRLHAVSILTAELFELHDRGRFEIYGFCWTPEDDSAMRRRIVRAMDHFVPIGALDDAAAARQIRACEIDVLVDLHGLTLGARPGIFAWRPAPVQVSYLGFAGTSGMDWMDYIVADRFLIPEEYARFYSEQPLYLPDVYQVNDRQRRNASPPSRAECGLPSRGFVYCSFNNLIKLVPEVFDAWMRVLASVDGSVLWLLGDSDSAQARLRERAQARGVNPDRLVFAERAAPEQHLARYRLADLFLDMFPCNAGATASDALWMGLPVLTLSGRSFASRMAGALLSAARLPELITSNLAEYERKAIELGRAPERCRELRRHLELEREQGVLFDTPRYVRALEDRLAGLVAALPQLRAQDALA